MGHQKRVSRIRQALIKGAPFSFYYHKGPSHTLGRASSQERLDISSLCHVLAIDSKAKTAHVEAAVTMQQLVCASKAFGLVPAVVPEFKEITVAGALMGVAGESGSHLFGAFYDICKEIEVLTAQGDVLTLTPQSDPTLFYGLSGSHGTLALVLSAKIALVEATEFVELTYTHFIEKERALSHLQYRAGIPDFLEAIIYPEGESVVIEGRKAAESSYPPVSLRSPGALWYFEHAEKSSSEKMALQEYFFRYDRAAFWIGRSLLSAHFLYRFILEGLLGTRDKGPLAPIKAVSSSVKRALLWPFMRSRTLWHLEKKATRWLEDKMIVQDFCLPVSQVPDFITLVQDSFKGPLWLCPIATTDKPQILAPHFTAKHDLLINVGIYGPVSNAIALTKQLEQEVYKRGGRKVLYSRSYYSKESFWQIYDKVAYRALQKRFNAPKEKEEGLY